MSGSSSNTRHGEIRDSGVTGIERNHNTGKETFMHNLHFILIKADSATDAAFEAENLILRLGRRE